MNLEQAILDVIKNNIEDGTVQESVEKEMTKAIERAVESVFRSYGQAGKLIEKQITSVVVPFLESYDYSQYIVKLEDVLVRILDESTIDNRQLLENFRGLMSTEPIDNINLSEIVDKWLKQAGKDVETDGLEIDYDDDPTYYGPEVEISFEEDITEGLFHTSIQGTLSIRCDHDSKLDTDIKFWKIGDNWRLLERHEFGLQQLKTLNEFQIFIIRLVQSRANVIIDKAEYYAEIDVASTPEFTCS